MMLPLTRSIGMETIPHSDKEIYQWLHLRVSYFNTLALTQKLGQRGGKDVGKALAHYRYSELPSPTNEINLVTFEKAGKALDDNIVVSKDPRLTSSFPCSPKTAKIAWHKFQNNLDEANISADDDFNGIQMRVPIKLAKSPERTIPCNNYRNQTKEKKSEEEKKKLNR